MAYYAYKTVRDLLPPHIIEAQGPNYEGDANYDGDQWYAAESYILELIAQRDEALARAKQLTEDLQMVAKYCDNLEPGDIKKFVTGALASKGGA